MDSHTREWHIRMIRHLRKRWGMVLIVDQALLGRGSLDDLEDDELITLHRNMHRAHECMSENISWEDAGLIHGQTGTW